MKRLLLLIIALLLNVGIYAQDINNAIKDLETVFTEMKIMVPSIIALRKKVSERERAANDVAVKNKTIKQLLKKVEKELKPWKDSSIEDWQVYKENIDSQLSIATSHCNELSKKIKQYLNTDNQDTKEHYGYEVYMIFQKLTNALGDIDANLKKISADG